MNTKDLNNILEELKIIFILEHELARRLNSKALEGFKDKTVRIRFYQKNIINQMSSALQREYAKKV